jgi:glutamyl-tRNA synthetase
MDWDVGPIVQSDDLEPYRAAMRALAGAGLAYPSELSRTDVEAAASAPQEGVHEVVFPASLRPDLRALAFDNEATNWRLAVPPTAVHFEDAFAGSQRFRPAETIGDFILWTKRGTPSYQLAVVVDDARQGVTQVVRGDDLLESAARQLLLYRALSLTPEPRYTHLPLVRGSDGKRLAKRHGDTRVETYRSLGVPAEALIGFVASWCGVLPADEPRPIAATEFMARLDLATIPREPIVFTPENDAWLRRQSR